MQEKLEKKPLLLYGKPMKQVSMEKYFGFQISETAADSVINTVSKRIGLSTKAIYEAKAVVEDRRSNAIGGLTVMFEIFETSIASMIYYGSENWTPLPQKTLQQLNKLTITYLRVALGLGKKSGAPIPALFWHTGTLLLQFRALFFKQLFKFHVANLDDDCLAKEFYTV